MNKYWMIVLLLAACGQQEEQHKKKPDFPLPVEMATAKTAPFTQLLEAVGSLKAGEDIIVRPEIAGRISKIAFTEGQPVAAGALLVVLDQQISNAQRGQAAAALRLAEKTHGRTIKLKNTPAYTRERFDTTSAALDLARATYNLAAASQAKTEIRAPFAGVVGLRQVSVGAVVDMNDALTTLTSVNPLKADFTVPETAASQLKAGQTVRLTVDALPNQTFMGKVLALEPAVDTNARALSVRATVDNSAGLLRPGFFARLKIETTAAAPLVQVPESAIMLEGAKASVLVVAQDGTPTPREVVVKARQDGQVFVETGLKAGEQVVASGQMKIFPGTKVTDIKKMPSGKK
jgi:membrane fusion protein, multidrug efflux system